VSTESTARYRGLTSCAGWLGGTNEGPRPASALPPGCTVENMPGGAKALVVVTGTDGSGFYDYEVTLFRTDGVLITVTTSNGLPLGATVDVTRPVPPLTIAQVETIAADPRWSVDQ
jgi:hypothetical protein